MLERHLKIINRLGLHARAAAKVVRTAGMYQSNMRLVRTDMSAVADAKSILSLLMLAASHGTELVMSVEGVDEVAAGNAMSELFASGFGEEAALAG